MEEIIEYIKQNPQENILLITTKIKNKQQTLQQQGITLAQTTIYTIKHRDYKNITLTSPNMIKQIDLQHFTTIIRERRIKGQTTYEITKTK